MTLLSLLTGRRPSDPPNMAAAEFKANPFPYYARLRAAAPAVRTVLPTGEPAWLVLRYDEAAAVLKDERFVSSAANALTPEQIARQPWFRKVFRSLQRNLLRLDPPDHTRLRALVSKAFTPRLVEQMRDRVQRLADELLDRVIARGRMDLVRDYALPLPVTIISEMLGVPAADQLRFHRWSNAIMAAAYSSWHMLASVPNGVLLIRYLRRVVRRRRADPGDDLVSALVRAEEAGDRLSEDELLAMTMLLLVAGHETTVNLIASGTLALLQHPDQLDRLRRDPGLIRPAVEELLRFTSPVDMTTRRFAREDVSLGGVVIPRGAMVQVVLTSANRDERQFADPDRLDITRDPNRHLSFGLGPHFCLGAPLARLEGQIAIGTLLRRLPALRLAVPPAAIRWRRGLLLRGVEALPVTFGPAGG